MESDVSRHMCVELVFDSSLYFHHLILRVYRELRIALFTDSLYGDIGESLYDSKIAVRHEPSFPQTKTDC